VNPFDSYYNGGGDPPIKEEDDNHRSDCMINNSNNTMDWMDPNAFDMLLQQQQQQGMCKTKRVYSGIINPFYNS
jgi:hypothetical protein